MLDKTDIDVVVGGDIIETLTAALYADPVVVFREYVQNSLDSFNSENVQDNERHIDIEIDVQNKIIKIKDNGAGIAEEDFKRIMSSFGHSRKQGNDGQIGFKGIGRLAGLPFCDQLVFSNLATGQKFSIDAEKYRARLNRIVRSDDLLKSVFAEIVDYEALGCGATLERGFQVEMVSVTSDLMKIITGKDCGERVSDEFKDTLRNMLPVPYEINFDKGQIIRDKYHEIMGMELSVYECNVKLNGVQIFKKIKCVGDKLFVVLPITLEGTKAGLVWLAFDYVLKSAGQDFGVAVRSQNVLMQGGSVFASEASISDNAITTYGQYLAACKCIYGEMLLDTKKLVENSQRDWFKHNQYSLILRGLISSIMNGIHRYRYAVSRYVNSEDRPEELKHAVSDAYKSIFGVSDSSISVGTYDIEQHVKKSDSEHFSREIDPRSDPSDLKGYPKSKKYFYKEMMDILYSYFCDDSNDIRLGVSGYYAMKAYVVNRLNDKVKDFDNA